MIKRKPNAEQIKNAINPADFYRHHLNAPLTKHGLNSGGLCVFHNDRKAGSFFVNLNSGAFICYSCGTKGGDIIAFTMRLYGLTFSEALAQLAHDWGL